MQEQIKAELKKSMMERNADRTGVMRGIMAAFTTELVSEQRIASGKTSADPLTDEECVKIIKREVKKRKDSIEQYNAAGRPELAESETMEMNILNEFLPAEMSREEIIARVSAKIAEAPVDPAKKGQFIGMMMKELGSSADGSLVKEVIDELVK
jgi:uncharacterized protein YqeY